VKDLHDKTIDFIKQFARDHFITLRGTEQTATDYDERITGVNWTNGGFNSTRRKVETVTFHPDHFSLDYKGATISGPLSSVKVETQVLVDGEEADCDVDDIEAAVEKACGFPLDPYGFEEPKMDL
jgi:hypothetical protein